MLVVVYTVHSDRFNVVSVHVSVFVHGLHSELTSAGEGSFTPQDFVALCRKSFTTLYLVCTSGAIIIFNYCLHSGNIVVKYCYNNKSNI